MERAHARAARRLARRGAGEAARAAPAVRPLARAGAHGRGCGPAGVRALSGTARRRARRTCDVRRVAGVLHRQRHRRGLAALAARMAHARCAGRRRVRARARARHRVLCLPAMAGRARARGRATRRARPRHGDRPDRGLAGRLRRGGQRRVAGWRCDAARPVDRRARRSVQRARPGMGRHHMDADGAARAGLRAVRRMSARGLRARGRRSHRSRARPRAAVGGARRRAAARRRVPALSARRFAAARRARIVPASRDRHRRGSRHRAGGFPRADRRARHRRPARALVRTGPGGRVPRAGRLGSSRGRNELDARSADGRGLVARRRSRLAMARGRLRLGLRARVLPLSRLRRRGRGERPARAARRIGGRRAGCAAARGARHAPRRARGALARAAASRRRRARAKDAAAGCAPVGAILAYVAQAPAPLAIFPLEDLLALEGQPNVPGPPCGHPNWRRRMPRSVDALFDAPARTRIAAVRRARKRAR